MSSNREELVVTGAATAEIMQKIQAAHKEEAKEAVLNAIRDLEPDTAICALVECIGIGIFLNKDIPTAADKLNYACSASGLVVSFTCELMKGMIETAHEHKA